MPDKCLFLRQAVLGNRERLFFMPHKLLVSNYHPNSSIFSLKVLLIGSYWIEGFIEWKILLKSLFYVSSEGR